MRPYLPCPICGGVEGCGHTFRERQLRSLAHQVMADRRSLPKRLSYLLAAGLLCVAAVLGAQRLHGPARSRAASLPPSKQSAPARPKTWLCGTVRTGGVSSPLMLAGTGELRLDLDQPAVVELRLQDRPCGAAR